MTISPQPVTLLAFLLTLGLAGAVGLVLARRTQPKGEGMESWGLGGRQFGTLITWFLVGGDFYTAYTLLAVPALVYGVGAAGFFALPYTILVYPIVFVAMPRLWTIARRHGLLTSADFVRLRYGNHWLASAVALTGILAVLPYIALQFSGVESILREMGLAGLDGTARVAPLMAIFVLTVTFTVAAGLRGPAMLAISKDIMIYVVVLVAVLLLPATFGGYHTIFARAAVHFGSEPGKGVVLAASGFSRYSTLALGSAMAAFLYPHTITGVLASRSANVIRKNAILLPAYTLLLGLIALFGLIAAGLGLSPRSPKDVVMTLFAHVFPHWFLGFSFAAILLAALVPASVMSVAAANLFVRNLFLEYLHPNADAVLEARVARLSAVLVTSAAFLMLVFLPTDYAINFQLLGGILILQTFPSVLIGLWRSPLSGSPLLLGWLAGLATSARLLYALHWREAVYPVHFGNCVYPTYIGLLALASNLLVAIVATFALVWFKSSKRGQQQSAA